MQTCPRCGTQSPDQAVQCHLCGMPLGSRTAGQPVAPAVPPTASANRTMLGIAPGQAAPTHKQTMLGISPEQYAQQPAQANAAKHTMLGISPGTPQAAQPPGPAAAKQTMLGIPMQPQQQPQPQGYANAPPTPAQQPMQPPVAQQPAANRTMLGIPAQQPSSPQHAPQGHGKQTMIGIPMQQPAAQPSPHAAAPTVVGTPGPKAPDLGAKKTMLGVAVPGIAPVNPGMESPKPHAPANRTMLGVAAPGIAPVNPGGASGGYEPVIRNYEGREYEAQAPSPTSSSRRPRSIPAAPPLHRRPAFVVAMLGFAVGIFIVGFALLWKSPPPLKSEARVDEKGQDLLHITCASCPDGTVLRIDQNEAKVSSTSADIQLNKPLVVGDNKFSVVIDRPNSGRDETVALTIPIAYRIRPDLSALSASPPSIKVLVEAEPGSTVTIDTNAVAIAPDGKGSVSIDVTSECTGQQSETKVIDKSIAYTVQTKGGHQDKGSVSVKVGVTPLLLDAPRAIAVVDSPSFLVAGRTAKGASIEIEGNAIQTNADGSFARRMRVERMGETEVRIRALSKDFAPRTVVFKVKRVSSLEDEAKAQSSAIALKPEALFAEGGASAGQTVQLSGEVMDARTQGNLTIALLDVAKVCSKQPCLVRLVVGAPDGVSKGDRLRVFGRFSKQFTEGGGKPVPEVDVDFFIKKAGN